MAAGQNNVPYHIYQYHLPVMWSIINAEVKLFYYKGKFITEFDNNKRFMLHADTIWLKKMKILKRQNGGK